MFRTMQTLLAAVCLLALATTAAAQDAEPAESGAKPLVAVKTSMGEFKLELNPGAAPLTVANFLRYMREGYYDGVLFDTAVRDYRIEAGAWREKIEKEDEQDPFLPPPKAEDLEKEQKVRPYKMEEVLLGFHDPIPTESENGLSNVRGTIAMNRRQDPGSATAMFYINVNDNAFLDNPVWQRGMKGMTVFGRVVEGMDVVDKIQETPVILHADHPVGRVTPNEKIVIESMRLVNDYDCSVGDAKLKAHEDEIAAKAAEEKNEERLKQSQLEQVIEDIEAEAGQKMTKTDSGLYYVIERKGDGKRHPTAKSKVKAHYWGRRLDGFEFDSSYERGAPTEFVVGQLIRGWSEGLQYMSEGAKAKFVIPGDLGYGSRGVGEDIPPDSWLVFQVELIEILK